MKVNTTSLSFRSLNMPLRLPTNIVAYQSKDIETTYMQHSLLKEPWQIYLRILPSLSVPMRGRFGLAKDCSRLTRSCDLELGSKERQIGVSGHANVLIDVKPMRHDFQAFPWPLPLIHHREMKTPCMYFFAGLSCRFSQVFKLILAPTTPFPKCCLYQALVFPCAINFKTCFRLGVCRFLLVELHFSQLTTPSCSWFDRASHDFTKHFCIWWFP